MYGILCTQYLVHVMTGVFWLVFHAGGQSPIGFRCRATLNLSIRNVNTRVALEGPRRERLC